MVEEEDTRSYSGLTGHTVDSEEYLYKYPLSDSPKSVEIDKEQKQSDKLISDEHSEKPLIESEESKSTSSTYGKTEENQESGKNINTLVKEQPYQNVGMKVGDQNSDLLDPCDYSEISGDK